MLKVRLDRFSAIFVRIWKPLFEPIDILELSEVDHVPGFVIILELPSLLCRAVECLHGKAVNDAEEGCSGEIQ
ncbi:hypothetical protein C491_13597 [Natronococcus amylolyticus DSM 10524]|uniref:Uncharacterized protein n=1 Tax=Natronococcus amylolyticus DSM 10524 TaxID=1227497 RepID=L9X2M7_9EURY|nr:hypothetical protein C491_13597 [Natronococcus amylolyticus DSM 10524]